MEKNQYGKKWSEEETILAFNLYCHMSFSKIDKRNKDIIALAQLLGRTPSSVGLKMANLAHFDPVLQKRSISGMRHASKTDEIIVQRFLNNWEELSYRATQIEANLRHESVEQLVLSDSTALPEGRSHEQVIMARVNQLFFRDAVLNSYQQSCCITGIAIAKLLVASHIKPWNVSDPKTERTNPRNGLCLNALHDRAFDKGLITVSPDLTVRVSSTLRSRADEGIAWLAQCHKQAIRKPERFSPSREFLEYHNDVVFIP